MLAADNSAGFYCDPDRITTYTYKWTALRISGRVIRGATTLQVNLSDSRYVYGGPKQCKDLRFGTVKGCANDGVLAPFNFDLRETPFGIFNTVDSPFVARGFNVESTITCQEFKSGVTQHCSGMCGGYCGGCALANFTNITSLLVVDQASFDSCANR